MPSWTFLLRDVQPVCEMFTQGRQGHRRVIDGEAQSSQPTPSTRVFRARAELPSRYIPQDFSTVEDLDERRRALVGGNQQTADRSGKPGRVVFLVMLHRLRSPTRS